MNSKIKCGNCNSEYAPRAEGNFGLGWDYSCPVCGHGKKNIQELQNQLKQKNILKG